MQAVHAALAPADVASRRSEVEMIYSCGIPQSLEGVANLASYHHSSLPSLALVSNFKSQFLLKAIIMFSVSNLSVSLEKQMRGKKTFQRSRGNNGFSVIVSF